MWCPFGAISRTVRGTCSILDDYSARDPSETTVFIIDDDEACRDSIRELVVSDGLAARVFGSAFEFLNALDPTWRGCLVLDLHMPGMNGLSLQKRLHKMGISLPIVFISGSVDIPTAFPKTARWTSCKSPIPGSCCWTL